MQFLLAYCLALCVLQPLVSGDHTREWATLGLYPSLSAAIDLLEWLTTNRATHSNMRSTW